MTRTRLKPDRRSAALLGAALVGIIAGGGALLYQQESSLASVTGQLRDKEKQRDESARLASRLAETEVRLKEDTDRLKFLEASLPSMAYVPTLLKQIEQLGRDTHNVVRGVRPELAAPAAVRPAVRRTDPEAQEGGDDKKAEEAPKPPDPYERLTIQVALTGSFRDYQTFLQRLTTFPKIVAVDKMQVKPRFENGSGPGAQHSGESPRLDVDMQLTAFILKDTPSTPAGTSAGSGSPSTGGPATSTGGATVTSTGPTTDHARRAAAAPLDHSSSGAAPAPRASGA